MIKSRLPPICLAAALCVDVKIDQSAYIDCLNEMFQSASKPATVVATPNPAAIPAPASGTYNQAATREMLGQSFGHSVFPARPNLPVPSRFPR